MSPGIYRRISTVARPGLYVLRHCPLRCGMMLVGIMILADAGPQRCDVLPGELLNYLGSWRIPLREVLHDVWGRGNKRRPVPPNLSDRYKAEPVDLEQRWKDTWIPPRQPKRRMPLKMSRPTAIRGKLPHRGSALRRNSNRVLGAPRALTA
jgi:hypothetical protein